MAPTLEEALSQVIKNSDGVDAGELANPPEESTTPDAPTPDDTQEITDGIQAVIDAYDAFKKSSKGDNWEQIGKDLQKLEEAIDNIR